MGRRRTESSVEVMTRLLHTYRVGSLLAEHDTSAVVPTLFHGLNSHLCVTRPATLLSECNLEVAAQQAVAVARAIAVGR